MFRPIRKKKNELPEADAKALLRASRRGVLAVCGDDGYPYALPINYFYDETCGKIYFHGAKTGHKSDAIDKCDKVCFTVVGKESVRAEAWAPFVRSVVVFGRCRKITDRGVADAKLTAFAAKYYPDEPTADAEIAASGAAVQMYELKIEHMTAKEVQEK